MTKKVENFLCEDVSYKIRGASFTVHNNLGGGHKESIYQKALAIELKRLGIKFEKEKSLTINYESENIGVYRPDFVINDKIILELKAVDFMPKSYEIQLLNYLKSTKLPLGFLINFGPKKVEIRRRVNFINQG